MPPLSFAVIPDLVGDPESLSLVFTFPLLCKEERRGGRGLPPLPTAGEGRGTETGIQPYLATPESTPNVLMSH